MNDLARTSFFAPLLNLGLAPLDDWFEYFRWAVIFCGGSYVVIVLGLGLVRASRSFMARRKTRRKPGYIKARAELVEMLEQPPPSARAYSSEPIIENSRSVDSGIPSNCGHPVVTEIDDQGVRLFSHHGFIVRSPYEDRLCAKCAETYVDLFSSRCAECRQAIFPTEPVADAWVGAPYPYTHLRCTPDCDLYCGLWGRGGHVSLNRLEPTQFPSGTRNLKTHQEYILQSRRRSSSK